MKQLELKIIGLDAILFSDNIKSLIAPGNAGSFGILPGHIAFVSSLKAGVCKIKNLNNSERDVDIKGGVLSVRDNKVTILVG